MPISPARNPAASPTPTRARNANTLNARLSRRALAHPPPHRSGGVTAGAAPPSTAADAPCSAAYADASAKSDRTSFACRSSRAASWTFVSSAFSRFRHSSSPLPGRPASELNLRFLRVRPLPPPPRAPLPTRDLDPQIPAHEPPRAVVQLPVHLHPGRHQLRIQLGQHRPRPLEARPQV